VECGLWALGGEPPSSVFLGLVFSWLSWTEAGIRE
jgi:hypothetical protein